MLYIKDNKGNIKYKIFFDHKHGNPVSHTEFHQGLRSSRFTVCTINDSNDNLITSSVAWTNPKDNFCKETGRKISLSRVMKTRTFQNLCNKNERREIWREYFRVTNKLHFLKVIDKQQESKREAKSSN